MFLSKQFCDKKLGFQLNYYNNYSNNIHTQCVCACAESVSILWKRVVLFSLKGPNAHNLNTSIL